MDAYRPCSVCRGENFEDEFYHNPRLGNIFRSFFFTYCMLNLFFPYLFNKDTCPCTKGHIILGPIEIFQGSPTTYVPIVCFFDIKIYGRYVSDFRFNLFLLQYILSKVFLFINPY